MIQRFAISRGVSPRESFAQVGELAAEIEKLGFEALWFIDHQLGMKDVYACMQVAAQHTQKLQIGPAVTNLKTRHPSVTANAITALQDISGGRALLGLGAGWVAVHSLGWGPSRVSEIRNGVDCLRGLLGGESVTYQGATFQLATARPQPPLPLYLAVSQPHMLRLCGEKLDGAILMGAADPGFCRWQLDYLYEGLEKSGRRRQDLLVDLTVTMSIDEDEEQATHDVRAWAASQAAAFLPWKRLPPGWERYRPQFEAAKNAYEYTDHLSLRAGHKHIVSDEFTRSVAIAGNLAHCLDRLREIAALDIDRITFALLSGGRKRRLEGLAREVIPQLAG